MNIGSIRSAKLGAVIAALGVALVATTLGFGVEEELGLAALFKLRGARPAPDEVMVVSIDKPSLDQRCVEGRFPDKLCTGGKWFPRSLHADLVDGLTRAGARVIVFDARFDTRRDADDARLGAAMARSGRVAVVEFLEREQLPLGSGMASKETLVPPIDEIRNGALATAPFVLPTRPVRVNEYSPFPRHAGEAAALPVVAFQIAALPAYARLLADCPALARRLPALPTDAAGFAGLVEKLRKIMTEDSDAADEWLHCTRALRGADPRTQRVLEALRGVYSDHGARYLDLYGPPRTIATTGYATVLEQLPTAPERFAGKAVFVGVSEALQFQQKDSYYTVFSRDDGLDVAGVELAATAYANLLEDREVRWHHGGALALVMVWGFAMGAIARGLPTPRAALTLAGLGILYGTVAYAAFAQQAVWLPLVVPLLLQAPGAFALGALIQHRELSREKANIRSAFGHFLPDAVVDELARDVTRIPTHSQLVSGTCLATDIEGYTQISESYDPVELRLVMNEYYTSVFSPVAVHRGIVSDVVGDAMVAIWAAATDTPALRERACRAALDIDAAAETFGRTPDHPALPTRIGLHSGQMALGNVGGMSHYEYRAVGDIVNTANRIQGLNKLLGTKVLVSSEVFEGVDGLVGRHLGEFRLRGKSKPVSIYELMAIEPDVTQEQRWLGSRFGLAVEAFRAQRWQDARSILLDVIERFPHDGPVRFYLGLLERKASSTEHWDGVIAVSIE